MDGVASSSRWSLEFRSSASLFAKIESTGPRGRFSLASQSDKVRVSWYAYAMVSFRHFTINQEFNGKDYTIGLQGHVHKDFLLSSTKGRVGFGRRVVTSTTHFNGGSGHSMVQGSLT